MHDDGKFVKLNLFECENITMSQNEEDIAYIDHDLKHVFFCHKITYKEFKKIREPLELTDMFKKEHGIQLDFSGKMLFWS